MPDPSAPPPVRGTDAVLAPFTTYISEALASATNGSVDASGFDANFPKFAEMYENPHFYKSNTEGMVGAPQLIFFCVIMVVLWVFGIIISCCCRCCCRRLKCCNPAVYSKRRKLAKRCMISWLMICVALYVVVIALCIAAFVKGATGMDYIVEGAAIPALGTVLNAKTLIEDVGEGLSQKYEPSLNSGVSQFNIEELYDPLIDLIGAYLDPADQLIRPITEIVLMGDYENKLTDFLGPLISLEEDNFYANLDSTYELGGNISQGIQEVFDKLEENWEIYNKSPPRDLEEYIRNMLSSITLAIGTPGSVVSDLVDGFFRCYTSNLGNDNLVTRDSAGFKSCLANELQTTLNQTYVVDLIKSFASVGDITNFFNSLASDIDGYLSAYYDDINDVYNMLKSGKVDGEELFNILDPYLSSYIPSSQPLYDGAAFIFNYGSIIALVISCLIIVLLFILPIVLMVACRKSKKTGCCCCRKNRASKSRRASPCSSRCTRCTSCCLSCPTVVAAPIMMTFGMIFTILTCGMLAFIYSNPNIGDPGEEIISSTLNAAAGGLLDKTTIYNNYISQSLTFAQTLSLTSKDGSTVNMNICLNQPSCSGGDIDIILDDYVRDLFATYSSDLLSCTRDGSSQSIKNDGLLWSDNSLYSTLGLSDYLPYIWSQMDIFTILSLLVDTTGVNSSDVASYGPIGALLLSYIGPNGRYSIEEIFKDYISGSLNVSISIKPGDLQDIYESVQNALEPLEESLTTCEIDSHVLKGFLSDQGSEASDNFYGLCCNDNPDASCPENEKVCETYDLVKGTANGNDHNCGVDGYLTLIDLAKVIIDMADSKCSEGSGPSGLCNNYPNTKQLVSLTSDLLDSVNKSNGYMVSSYDAIDDLSGYLNEIDTTLNNIKNSEFSSVDMIQNESDLKIKSNNVDRAVETNIFDKIPAAVGSVLNFIEDPSNVGTGSSISPSNEVELVQDVLHCNWLGETMTKIPDATGSYTDDVNLVAIALLLWAIAGFMGMILTNLGPLEDLGKPSLDGKGNPKYDKNKRLLQEKPEVKDSSISNDKNGGNGNILMNARVPIGNPGDGVMSNNGEKQGSQKKAIPSGYSYDTHNKGGNADEWKSVENIYDQNKHENAQFSLVSFDAVSSDAIIDNGSWNYENNGIYYPSNFRDDGGYEMYAAPGYDVNQAAAMYDGNISAYNVEDGKN